MRLICPNCGAQYEVAQDVVPEAGRDVQCSNCGHTWFEKPGDSEAAELETPPEPQRDIMPERPTSFEEPEIDAEPPQDPEPEPQPEPEPEPRGRELDSGVADILRAEAELEQAARRGESAPIETQTDLDLSQDPEPAATAEVTPEVPSEAQDTDQQSAEASRRNREARDRLAKLRGDPDIAAAVGATMAQEREAPRSELLPDIEEINSSLRPDAPQTEAFEEYDLPVKRSKFRRGFMLMVILAVIALVAYIFAPQISAAVPQLDAALSSYVNWVDGLRIMLDQRLEGLSAADANDG